MRVKQQGRRISQSITKSSETISVPMQKRNGSKVTSRIADESCVLCRLHDTKIKKNKQKKPDNLIGSKGHLQVIECHTNVIPLHYEW